LDDGLPPMIDSSAGNASVLTSLQVPAGLGQDSYCLFTVLFGRGIFPLVALLVPCMCGSERWSVIPTVLDDNLFFMEYMDASVMVNETVHRSSSSLFTVCFMDAAKLAKSLFLHFRIQNLFYSKHHR
jgi:hypothetical protein